MISKTSYKINHSNVQVKERKKNSRRLKLSYRRKELLARNLSGAPRSRRPYREEIQSFTKVPNEFITCDGVSPKAKMLWIYLAKFAWGDKNDSYPRRKRIARDLNISERTVSRGIRELEEHDLVTVDRGKRRSNTYRLFVRKQVPLKAEMVSRLSNRPKIVFNY